MRRSAAPREKLSVRVAETLREQLMRGELSAGEKLPTEQRLTEIFGVSRTVVREAIATLAADGLVVPRQGAGVFVADHPLPSFGAMAGELARRVSNALNMLEVRLAMEVEGAALAAERRNPTQEAEMHEAYLEFDRLLREGKQTGPADFAFHRAIAQATGNPFYVELLDAMGRRAIPGDVGSIYPGDPAREAEMLATVHREHLDVLTAIGDGDPDRARSTMRLHLVNSQERYREHQRRRATPA
ncbi:FadR/GntR family transcriptional regulator [Devosia sp.]|uniref:FadR/GntR family transcriptional regulator n=1 Tax=Devosia sp. TaxID=1871048 RepID=UPI003A8E4A9B